MSKNTLQLNPGQVINITYNVNIFSRGKKTDAVHTGVYFNMYFGRFSKSDGNIAQFPRHLISIYSLRNIVSDHIVKPVTSRVPQNKQHFSNSLLAETECFLHYCHPIGICQITQRPCNWYIAMSIGIRLNDSHNHYITANPPALL